jgi:predicted O-methyltransferase YrrM
LPPFHAPARYFEIGTGDGRSALLVAANTPASTQLYTLDPGYPSEPIKGSVFRNRPEAAKIEQLSGSSLSFDFAPYHGQMDLVFVDGSHALADVVVDSHTAFKLAAPGARILWHDLLYDSCEVIQAIDVAGYAQRVKKIAGSAYGTCTT